MPVHPDDPKGVPPGLRLPATLRCAHASGTVPRPGTRMRAQATSQVTSGAPMTTEVPPNHAPSNDGHFGCPVHTKACPHEKKGAPPTTCQAAPSTPPDPNEQAQSHRGLTWCLRTPAPPLSEPGCAGPVTTKDTPRHASPPSAHLEPSDAAYAPVPPPQKTHGARDPCTPEPLQPRCHTMHPPCPMVWYGQGPRYHAVADLPRSSGP